MLPPTCPLSWTPGSRRDGNVLILAVLIMSLLVALTAAQISVYQKNARASSFYLSRSELHRYAENGVSMALHDIQYGVSGSDGNIGTASWTQTNDLGADGIGGTHDEGEGDGIPTIGEPNTHPVAVGPTQLGGQLLTYAGTTGFSNILRIASTARSPDGSVTIDTYVKRTTGTMPKVAAVFVDPAVALDLKGNSFVIDGNDHNPDGTAGSGAAVPGIATAIGDPPDSNKALLLAQISSKNYGQVRGAGGTPSVGETTGVDLNVMFDAFKGMASQTIASGTYTDPSIGDHSTGNYLVTYANGDLHFSGQAEGAGVLLVDGSVFITGQFSFYGLMIVRGDITLSGGGSGIHNWGSILVGQSITAVDVSDPDLAVKGNADIFYSSMVLQQVEAQLQSTYSVVYYDEH